MTTISSADLVGKRTGPVEHRVDARWAMAYAAGIDDLSEAYFDNRDGRPLAIHPVFPVCLEWPVLVASMAEHGVDMRRSVHATHDLHLVAPLVADETYTTTATIVGVEQRKPGVYLGWRFDTSDSAGRVVCQTSQGNLFLGATLEGEARWSEPMPPLPGFAVKAGVPRSCDLLVPLNMAHVYTECARIWNPIHTDRAVAAAHGIGEPLLHGTATLALAVSALVARVLDGDPSRVRRITARFAARVELPNALALEFSRCGTSGVCFSAKTADGQTALRDGHFVYV